jgi:REP element-mobilizing transposase RayT
MPYVRNWLHCVWGTKRRYPFLTQVNKKVIFDHIKENCKEKGIYLDFIYGYRDHVHILISLNQEQNVSNIMRLIKGESSRWINKEKLTDYKFEWSDEYFAVSLSDSQVNRIREYIKNQDCTTQPYPADRNIANSLESIDLVRWWAKAHYI